MVRLFFHSCRLHLRLLVLMLITLGYGGETPQPKKDDVKIVKLMTIEANAAFGGKTSPGRAEATDHAVKPILEGPGRHQPKLVQPGRRNQSEEIIYIE
jgi:hypothetical protein